MRILLIDSALSPSDRLRLVDDQEPAQLLTQAGHEVTVLVPRLLPLSTWRGLAATWAENEGSPTVRVDLLAAPYVLQRHGQRTSARLAARKLTSLGVEPPDVVHASIADAVLAKELGLIWGRPYVLIETRRNQLDSLPPGKRHRAALQSIKDAAGIAATDTGVAKGITESYARTDVQVIGVERGASLLEQFSDLHHRALKTGQGPRMIFHAPYPIDPHPLAASRLRPLKMREAFRELGFQVHEITGNPRDRAIGYRDARRRRRAGQNLDFLYSENSTQPNLLATSIRTGLAPLLEARIFLWSRWSRIPTGEFYRDIYWRFLRSVKEIGSLRSLVRHLAYRGDLAALRLLGVHLFLPSEVMGPELPYPKGSYTALPPGADVRESKSPEGVHLLYVGGVGENHGLHACVEAVATTDGATLTMCVPEDAWLRDGSAYAEHLNDRIRVVHARSHELAPYYDEATACVLFVEPSPYRKFAAPVKFFEYLGYGKPMLLSEGTYAGRLGAEMGVGVEIPYTPQDFARTLQELVAEPERLRELTARAREARHDHTWIARALEAISVLRPSLAAQLRADR